MIKAIAKSLVWDKAKVIVPYPSFVFEERNLLHFTHKMRKF